MSIPLIRPYDVYLEEAVPSSNGVCWKLMSATHLLPSENLGRHNVYVSVVDDMGNRVTDANLRIGWSWEGRRDDEPAPPLPLDKRDGEPPGNLPLFSPGMKASVWITGDGNPSDKVVNLHTNHPDELGPGGEVWNSVGHHSFNLIFQRVKKAIGPPVTPPPDEKPAKIIIITAPDMTITMLDGSSTTGPATVTIAFTQGQNFAKG